MRRRRQAAWAAGAGIVAAAGYSLWRGSAPRRHCPSGIVWQPDLATIDPHGAWQKLGGDTLLVQWSMVGGQSLLPLSGAPTFQPQPNWTRIGQEPWAAKVILGLAGDFSEAEARRNLPTLIQHGIEIGAACRQLPLHITGFYFPVEVDPSWEAAATLAASLQALPRPLWISAYDSQNIGPEAFAAWVARWLPADCGLFFQDGVGVYARSAGVAGDYAERLHAQLGPQRFALIAEAFRPRFGGGFRPATVAELAPQMALYERASYRFFLFDGPHYLTPELIAAYRCKA